MDKNILEKVETIYNYLNINMKYEPSDVILGLGCMDLGIPKLCSTLYKKGFSKKIIFTGNVGKGTIGVLKTTEAERYKNIAIQEKVNENDIILETNATNTFENYKFCKNIIIEKNLNVNKIIVIQKPYVKRRCKAISDIVFFDKIVYVVSEDLSLNEFIEHSIKANTMTLDQIINEIVGEISIILLAPKYNLQKYQDIPKQVIDSYYYLINQGFDKCLTDDEKLENISKKINNYV